MSKKRAKPIKILTLDTETYGLAGGLKRIAVYDGKKVYNGYVFKDIEPVLINYYSLGYNVIVYIHNLEFDLRKLGADLLKEIMWNKSLIINNKVAKIQFEKYCFLDSFKILPFSLKKLSKDFEVRHGKMDLWDVVNENYPNQYNDIEDYFIRCDKDDPIYVEYLGYDVISLYEIIEKVHTISGLELKDFVSCVSTSSLSRKIFKKGYHGHEFSSVAGYNDFDMLCSYDYTRQQDIEDFLRLGYCGGRCEVFIPQLKTLGKHYDVNSLYPSEMLGEFPVGKPYFSDNPKIVEKYWNDWCEDRGGLGIVNCAVYIPPQEIPPLPVKMGKLTFPTGEVYGTWTYEELLYSIENCGVVIREFYAICHYERTYPVFRDFITHFYKMKEQATEDENYSKRTFAKLLMNCGYGYTGMKRDDKTQLDFYSNKDKHDCIFADETLGYCEYNADIKSKYIQVQIAAYVTSRARLVWLKAARAILQAGGNVYYGDTDSIVTDIDLPKEMVSHTDLGLWDLESKPIEGLFLMPKVYYEVLEQHRTVKFKGVSRDTQKTLEYVHYKRLYKHLRERDRQFEIVEKNKSMMSSLIVLYKNDENLNKIEYRDKKFNYLNMQKRIMDYENNITYAHHFNTIEEFENFEYTNVKKEVELNV